MASESTMNTHVELANLDDRIALGLAQCGKDLEALCGCKVGLVPDRYIGAGCRPDSDELMPFLTRAFCAVSQYFSGHMCGVVQTVFLKNPSHDLYSSFASENYGTGHNELIESDILCEVGNMICSDILSAVWNDEGQGMQCSLPDIQHGSYEVLISDCSEMCVAKGYLVNAEIQGQNGIHRDRLIAIVCLSTSNGEVPER